MIRQSECVRQQVERVVGVEMADQNGVDCSRVASARSFAKTPPPHSSNRVKPA